MEVRDIFKLREEGRSEEAYNLIRERYKVHHGHYTTICMFLCAADVAKLRINAWYEMKKEEEKPSHETDEKCVALAQEATAIFLSMQRLYPNLDDKEGSFAAQMYYLAERIKRVNPDFSMLLFLNAFGLQRLQQEDWLPEYAANDIPRSKAARLLSAVHEEMMADPTPDNRNAAKELFIYAAEIIPSSYLYRHWLADCDSATE